MATKQTGLSLNQDRDLTGFSSFARPFVIIETSKQTDFFKRDFCLVPDSNKMDSLGLIEVEYIKNLQKQVCLLECETSYLREKAKEATSIQPKVTRDAEKILQKIKELETAINTAEIQTAQKENSTNMVEAETHAMYRHLQTLSDANIKEKLVLMENVTKLKKLADISAQDVSWKEEELLKIQREIQQTVNSVKEKEYDVHLLESQLQPQIQQHQGMERKLAESRSECIRLQALLHQLEEKLLTSSQSTQQHIAKELSEETEKLRQILKEKELSADEDKYVRDKMAEDCGHLTRENGLLQAQVLEATRQLSKEKQLREEESTSHSRRASELVSRKEKEQQLEMELTYLKTLLQNERQRVLKVFHLQQERKSVDQNGQLLQSQLTDLEKRHAEVQLENSKLQREKTHLVDHISHLHKEIAEKEKKLNSLHSHVNNLFCDFNNYKSQVNTASILEKEKWKEFSSILTANHTSMS
ncbi:structural maintenance of chromosomes protein 2-like isoform X2 [Rhineura floridana]|uniref:structural maintenance of chromosomes protein 2-like isoform X2 n=1 Tax=Rhineura floridana TaxID=261503 RepID=UPI002AC863DA|nr:structural maintenance of chromosomes protein 2-like isoform X2 [Rhineura floridana]